MSVWRRLKDMNSPRVGESQRDFLARMGDVKFSGYVPRQVYAELVELHDRVERLEAQLAARSESRPG